MEENPENKKEPEDTEEVTVRLEGTEVESVILESLRNEQWNAAYFRGAAEAFRFMCIMICAFLVAEGITRKYL